MEFDENASVVWRERAKLTSSADKRLITFHCQKCKTILGDGFSVCGESLGYIICLKVTKDVVVNEKKDIGYKGEMAHCIYSSMTCRCCRNFVGRFIYSSASRLASGRDMFLLHKAHISCYILDSCTMVKATSLCFNVRPLLEKMNEMMQKFEVQSKRMSILENKMKAIKINTQGVNNLDKRLNN